MLPLISLCILLAANNVIAFLFVPNVDFHTKPSQFTFPDNTTHCYPNQACWPPVSEIMKFQHSLDGQLLFPSDAEFQDITVMKNLRVTKHPAMIVVVKTVNDVQKSIKWARAKSMRIVVQSSGHDFQGRSTADGALMIYLGKMTNISINLNSQRSDCPYGEISLESGNQWKNVYLELDKVDRVMIGGSAHTVAIGGYTLGGGHSPISRMYGLAVDNLLEVEMITADAKFVVANDNGTTTTDLSGQVTHSPNNDLFWACLGGGGGTFGVVTKFKFRLHEAPKKMVKFACNFAMYNNGVPVAKQVLDKLGDLIIDMPRQWGGYWMMSILPYQNTAKVGTITMYFNHFGDWSSPSRSYMEQLRTFRPDWQRSCFYQNASSFWDYEKDSHDQLYYRNSIIGTLLQKESFSMDGFKEFLIQTITYPKKGSLTGITGTLLGGAMMNVSTTETSVHPGFRSALTSLTLGASWQGDGSTDAEFTNYMEGLNTKIEQYGNGSYPNESGGNNTNWKSDYWGHNYDRLAQIKKSWDPDNVFMCRECIAWDKFKN